MTVTFDDFWREYPRRTAKPAALKSWQRAVDKMKLDPAAIVAGAKRYAEAKRGTEQQFIAHPATWINQQRWTDEEAPAPSETGSAPRSGPNYSNAVTATRIAQDIQRKMMERTRHHWWSKIETAAARLKDATPSELWDAMTPELLKEAWDLACEEALRGTQAPQMLDIQRKHWITGKERHESRARCIRGMLNPRLSELQPLPNIRPKRRAPDDEDRTDPAAAEDEGMARASSLGPGGFGREHPDERGLGEDPAALEGEDGEGAA